MFFLRERHTCFMFEKVLPRGIFGVKIFEVTEERRTFQLILFIRYCQCDKITADDTDWTRRVHVEMTDQHRTSANTSQTLLCMKIQDNTKPNRKH